MYFFTLMKNPDNAICNSKPSFIIVIIKFNSIRVTQKV